MKKRFLIGFFVAILLIIGVFNVIADSAQDEADPLDELLTSDLGPTVLDGSVIPELNPPPLSETPTLPPPPLGKESNVVGSTCEIDWEATRKAGTVVYKKDTPCAKGDCPVDEEATRKAGRTVYAAGSPCAATGNCPVDEEATRKAGRTVYAAGTPCANGACPIDTAASLNAGTTVYMPGSPCASGGYPTNLGAAPSTASSTSPGTTPTSSGGNAPIFEDPYFKIFIEDSARTLINDEITRAVDSSGKNEFTLFIKTLHTTNESVDSLADAFYSTKTRDMPADKKQKAIVIYYVALGKEGRHLLRIVPPQDLLSRKAIVYTTGIGNQIKESQKSVNQGIKEITIGLLDALAGRRFVGPVGSPEDEQTGDQVTTSDSASGGTRLISMYGLFEKDTTKIIFPLDYQTAISNFVRTALTNNVPVITLNTYTDTQEPNPEQLSTDRAKTVKDLIGSSIQVVASPNGATSRFSATDLAPNRRFELMYEITTSPSGSLYNNPVYFITSIEDEVNVLDDDMIKNAFPSSGGVGYKIYIKTMDKATEDINEVAKKYYQEKVNPTAPDLSMNVPQPGDDDFIGPIEPSDQEFIGPIQPTNNQNNNPSNSGETAITGNAASSELPDITEMDFASKKSGPPIKWCAPRKSNQVTRYSDIQSNCPPSERTYLFEGGPGGLIPNQGIDPLLIKQLNEIQDRLGKKVIVESGVRDYEHNLWSWAKLESDKAAELEINQNKVFTTHDEVSLKSWHIYGGAADFRIEGYDTDSEHSLLKKESDRLERVSPKGWRYAYKSKEGRDPDNYNTYPYIHADNGGFGGISRTSAYRKYKKVTDNIVPSGTVSPALAALSPGSASTPATTSTPSTTSGSTAGMTPIGGGVIAIVYAKEGPSGQHEIGIAHNNILSSSTIENINKVIEMLKSGRAIVPVVSVTPSYSAPSPGTTPTSATIPSGSINYAKSSYNQGEIHTISVNPEFFDIEVAASKTTTSKAKSKTKEIMVGAGGIAAINAGFFHNFPSPRGWDHVSLVVENGVKLSDNYRLSDAMPEDSANKGFNACFIVKKSGNKRTYDIVPYSQFRASEALYAICSPSYVTNHDYYFPCDVFDEKRSRQNSNPYCAESNRRSVLAIKDDGTVDLIIAKKYTIPQLGEYLANNYNKAIALDGGGSVSMEHHYGGTDKSIGWDTGNTQRIVTSAIVVKQSATAVTSTPSTPSTASASQVPATSAGFPAITSSGICSDPSSLPKRSNGDVVELVVLKGPDDCGVEGGSSNTICQKIYYCVNGQVKDLGFGNSVNGAAHTVTGSFAGDYKLCECQIGSWRNNPCCVTPAGVYTAAGKERNHNSYSKAGWFYLVGEDPAGTPIPKRMGIAVHDIGGGRDDFGWRKSHGCIRMHRDDMNILYPNLEDGDTITVRPDGVDNRGSRGVA